MLCQKIQRKRLKQVSTTTTSDLINPFNDLKEIAAEVVSKNIQYQPNISDVCPKAQLDKIVDRLSINLPITITARNIEQESYWERACKEKQPNVRPEKHGCTWKQSQIESLILQEILECNDDDKSILKLEETLEAARFDVHCLVLPEFHGKISNILNHIPMVTQLSITYGARHVGMEYERNLFGMKIADAADLAEKIKYCNLTKLSLPSNLIDDDLIRILVSGLIVNKTLSQLELSHNKISDNGARRLAKYLLKTEILTHLDLSDNKIHQEGSRCLGHALRTNKSLSHLSLKLNCLSDKAGAKFANDLAHNSTIKQLDLSSNYFGCQATIKLSDLLQFNPKITFLDLSCNPLGEEAGEILKAGLEKNTTICHIDVRNTQMPYQLENEITIIATKNDLQKKKIPQLNKQKIKKPEQITDVEENEIDKSKELDKSAEKIDKSDSILNESKNN